MKGGAKQGMQFKKVIKPDATKEFLKQYPDIFKNLYPDG